MSGELPFPDEPLEPVARPAAGPAARDADEDAAARRLAAREFGRPLLFEAGAGTGKTATLVARIVAWVLGPGWDEAERDARARERDAAPEGLAATVLERTCAITFTEAAAAEMARRVGEALLAVEEGRPPLGLDAESVRPETAGRARALRANLERLAVSTIHAFCRRLLAAHPLEAGMAPDFSVDATEAGLEEVTREALERALRAAWSTDAASDLLTLLARGRGPQEIETALLDVVRRGARSEHFALDPLRPQVIEAKLAALRKTLADVRRIGAPLATIKGNRVTVEVYGLLASTDALLAAARTDGEDALTALRDALTELWQRRIDRVKQWSRLGDPKKNKRELEAVQHDLDAFRAAAGELRSRLTSFLELDAVLLSAARRVARELLGAIESELTARGVATFADLLRGAHALLERHPALAAAERRKIAQLLVDEFQDTDVEQCAIVTKLALEGRGRPGLFVVGDPKQSIYGWRNADLAAYEGFKRRLVAEGGEIRTLDVNFRSVPAILDEVRRVVGPVMTEVAGVQPPFVPLRASERTRGREGFVRAGHAAVEHWVSWPQDERDGTLVTKENTLVQASYEAEARAIALDVAWLHAREGVAYSQCALLFRSGAGIETYLHAFREAGVPYQVQGDRSFYQRREVIDAAALVRCVLDPSDHLALVTFLRSPAVGVPDAALPALWTLRFPEAVSALYGPDPERLARLDALVREAARRVPRSVPGMGRLAGWEEGTIAALHALARARRTAERAPADVFVEELVRSFQLEAVEGARYLGSYRLANLQRFFRELLGAIDESKGDTQAVLRALRVSVQRARAAEEGRPLDAAEDAVQVMTMHGAKGLDFEHVYLTQLHRGRLDPWIETDFDAREDAVEYRLFGASTPGYGDLKERRDRVENAERVRLLYVAMTRAKERLVLLGHWPQEPRAKPWDDAQTFVDLLGARDGAGAALAALAEAADLPPEARPDAHAALWKLAARPPVQTSADADSPARAELADADALRARGRALSAARADAQARMERPWTLRASDEAHERLFESFAATRFEDGDAAPAGAAAEPLPAATRDVALLAGTVVHRVLEELDVSCGAAAALARARADLERHVDPRAGEGERTAAVARARELLRRIETNGMLERLVGLANSVVARELAVLARPDDAAGAPDAPVGFVSGAIDLLYRDPRTGELVVVDYKTDALSGEDELSARAGAYRLQGRRYTEALRDALALPRIPRFELWFLYPGRVVDAS